MKKASIRVLVTGAGSGVGQGVIKALQRSPLPLEIVASDVSHNAAGLYWTQERAIIPRLEEPGADHEFTELLRSYRIDVVLPGSEHDVLPLAIARHEIERAVSTKIAVTDPRWVELANDKWLSFRFLSEKGIPVPSSTIDVSPSALAAFADDVGFPLIVKPRIGTSSRSVHLVHNLKDLREAVSTVVEPIIQTALQAKGTSFSAEFTCSLFRDWQGTIFDPLCMRRTLRSGSSWQVEVDEAPEIANCVTLVGRHFDCLGPLNVQLIETDEGPQIFELNCRFSGTTGIRAIAGANEPEAAVLSLYYGKSANRFQVKRGTALRYLDEVFVEDLLMSDIT